LTDPAMSLPPQNPRAAQSRFSAFAFFMLLCLFATVSSAAAASWNSLSPSQQEALAPLAQQWDTLPEEDQQRWIKTAKRYPGLSPEKKQRFRNRVAAWNKLTPEQRKAAREKYRAFKKVPKEKRDQVKQMIKQEEAKKAQQPPADTPAAATSPQP